MTSEELISKFQEMFPIVSAHTVNYILSEKDCVIVETDNKNRFRFKFFDDGFKLTRIK